MDPFSLFFSGLQSIFTFADFAVRVGEVSTENEVFVRTIQVVRNDLNETERLLSIKSIQTKLISTPQKLEWIKGAIYSTKSSLNEIGKWVERARVDQEALGKVKFENRVRWVFNDHEKLLNRKTELSTCHQQLSNVLSFLVPLEEVAAGVEPPTYHATTFFDDMMSPRQQRRTRSNEMASGVQSTAVLDYFPSTTASTEHASSVPLPSPAMTTHIFPNVQPQPEITSPIPYNTCPTADAQPPEYTAYEERVSDGMRYDGSHTAAMSTLLLQKNSSVYSQNPLCESSSEEPKMVDHKDRKQRLSLSHTRSLAIRGSNRYGPVDQFELFTESIPEKHEPTHPIANITKSDISTTLKTMIIDDTPIPVEAPGELSLELPTVRSAQLPAELPVELPSERSLEVSKSLPIADLGPPPGYPRGIARKPVPELPSYVAYRPEGSKPQRQGKPVSRPTSRILHSNSMPMTSSTQAPSFRYEMEDASSSVSQLSTPRPTSISSVSSASSPMSSPKMSSFSTHSHPVQHTLHSSYSSVSLVSESSSYNSQLQSPWSTSMSSASAAPSPMSSPALSSSTLATPKWQTARVRPSTGPQTLSSTRMRNQKSYMDLLGSIGNTR